jgi:hypothetical protein
MSPKAQFDTSSEVKNFLACAAALSAVYPVYILPRRSDPDYLRFSISVIGRPNPVNDYDVVPFDLYWTDPDHVVTLPVPESFEPLLTELRLLSGEFISLN